MIVDNYKRIIVPNDSLNPTHLIVVSQAKPQPKDQMRVVPPQANRYIYAQMPMPYMGHYKR